MKLWERKSFVNRFLISGNYGIIISLFLDRHISIHNPPDVERRERREGRHCRRERRCSSLPEPIWAELYRNKHMIIIVVVVVIVIIIFITTVCADNTQTLAQVRTQAHARVNTHSTHTTHKHAHTHADIHHLMSTDKSDVRADRANESDVASAARRMFELSRTHTRAYAPLKAIKLQGMHVCIWSQTWISQLNIWFAYGFVRVRWVYLCVCVRAHAWICRHMCA